MMLRNFCTCPLVLAVGFLLSASGSFVFGQTAADPANQDSNVTEPQDKKQRSGNPVFEGWYADPEGIVFGDRYWIFPTYSAAYDDQLFFDAFSSADLVHWTRHAKIVSTQEIKWAYRALWAPCCVEKDDRYYLFFGANDLQRPGGPLYDPTDKKSLTGGIGVAVADSPAGPYKDHLGKPLVGDFHNDAQPIDQFVFQDEGKYYFYYGGWGRCNVGVLNEDFSGFVPFDDGEIFHEITPKGYVEGPVLFKRKGKYYFMWSQGGWGNSTYHVAYAVAESPLGPFVKKGTVLESDESLATGAGHNSVMQVPGQDQWYIVYHRRPIPNEGRDHRVVCVDVLEFDEQGNIKPVKMTREGVVARPLPPK